MIVIKLNERQNKKTLEFLKEKKLYENGVRMIDAFIEFLVAHKGILNKKEKIILLPEESQVEEELRFFGFSYEKVN